MSLVKTIIRKDSKSNRYIKSMVNMDNQDVIEVGSFVLPRLKDCVGKVSLKSNSESMLTKKILEWDLTPSVLVIDGKRS